MSSIRTIYRKFDHSIFRYIETFTRRKAHDRDKIKIPTCRYEMCRVYVLQIQSSKCVLDHADYTAPIRHRELQIIRYQGHI